ncbi:hypothetical protein [Microseira wollei]|uniref:DUF2808 domain-containing protein n=1 Tax=Microseira wollei NIES-4236 TaxID=2530354 RepID=A0AAV3XFI8_9CYAN|nr:hypothetical protein [Microseira wollei]GET41149.1 hypothetical protein MiSe_59610 [Microseira wollei NIES-4236]
MVRLLLLLALAICTACNAAPLAEANHLQVSPVAETTMHSPTDISIRSVTLLAREDRMPPKGVRPQPNRDIGFASVFLRIENLRREDTTLTIRNVEIRNVSDNTLQVFSRPPQEIHSIPEEIRLTPLANAEIGFHFTNKTGYVGQDRVRAVVTYQIGEQVSVVMSDPVEVNRH